MNTSSSDLRHLPGRLEPASTSGRGTPDTTSAPHAAVPEESAGPAGGAAFGEFLRQARERRQITLDQVAEETKIASRHLTALEQGNVKSLPGGMYRRAMLRAYADSIGLDKDAALDQFERTFEPRPRRPAPAPAAIATVEPATAPRRAVASRTRDLRVLLVVVVLSATAVVGLVRGDESGTLGTVPAVAPSSDAAPERSLTSPSPAPGSNIAPAQPTRSAAAPATLAEPSDPQPVASAPAPSASFARQPSPATAVGTAATAPTSGRAPAVDTTPAPERPAATAGQLIVATNPSGARVTVNGTGWGVTPVTVRHLPFGSKRIRVTLDGYETQERTIALSPGRPAASLTLTLTRRQ